MGEYFANQWCRKCMAWNQCNHYWVQTMNNEWLTVYIIYNLIPRLQAMDSWAGPGSKGQAMSIQQGGSCFDQISLFICSSLHTGGAHSTQYLLLGVPVLIKNPYLYGTWIWMQLHNFKLFSFGSSTIYTCSEKQGSKVAPMQVSMVRSNVWRGRIYRAQLYRTDILPAHLYPLW